MSDNPCQSGCEIGASNKPVSKAVQDRREELYVEFIKWPLVQTLHMEMPELYPDRVVVTMPVPNNLANGDGILPGMVVAISGNIAGVHLAMMNSENFTPLPNTAIHWLKPVVVGKDKMLIANATLIQAGKTLIVVEIKILNEAKELKAVGTFTFVNR